MSSPPTGGYNCGGGGEKDEEEEEEEEEKLAVVELGNGLAATARRKAAHSSTVVWSSYRTFRARQMAFRNCWRSVSFRRSRTAAAAYSAAVAAAPS